MGEIAQTPGRKRLSGTAEQGYLHCGPSGAGHFVKMVHNGIEYGMMAAYAEGLNILRHANEGKQATALDAETTPMRNPEFYQYELNLPDVAEVWRRGSVISSWLLTWRRGADRQPRPGEVCRARVGLRRGAVDDPRAIDEAVPVPVLSAALYERFSSRGADDFADKMLSALRYQFGGHLEKTGDEKEKG